MAKKKLVKEAAKEKEPSGYDTIFKKYSKFGIDPFRTEHVEVNETEEDVLDVKGGMYVSPNWLDEMEKTSTVIEYGSQEGSDQIEEPLSSDEDKFIPENVFNPPTKSGTQRYKGIYGEPSSNKKVEYPYIKKVSRDTTALLTSNREKVLDVELSNFDFEIAGFTGFENLYSRGGIESVKRSLDFIINKYNSHRKNYGLNSRILGMFRLTDRYEEVVDLFYKISGEQEGVATDMVESDCDKPSRTIVFMLKLNK